MRHRHLLLLLALLLAACAAPATDRPATQAAEAPASIPDLGLTGRLYYAQGPEGLWALDLDSGEARQVFAPPDGGEVQGVAASPDGSTLALAYVPPPEEGAAGVPRADLYLLDADGGGLRPLLVHQGTYQSFADPAWSPDGRWVYATRHDARLDDQGQVTATVEEIVRLPADGPGPAEVVVESAAQVSFSADGSRMAYLRFNPDTFLHALMVAKGDGSDPVEVVGEADFALLSAAVISPDGAQVAFTASAGEAEHDHGARPRWLAWLGPQPAEAHGLPADLWLVSAQGGEPRRLTDWAADTPLPAWSAGGDLFGLRPGGLYLLGEQGPVFLAEAEGHGDLTWGP